jgi:hypothetical protein
MHIIMSASLRPIQLCISTDVESFWAVAFFFVEIIVININGKIWQFGKYAQFPKAIVALWWDEIKKLNLSKTHWIFTDTVLHLWISNLHITIKHGVQQILYIWHTQI